MSNIEAMSYRKDRSMLTGIQQQLLYLRAS